jgi:CBS domain containing-hemolysin-like protein
LLSTALLARLGSIGSALSRSTLERLREEQVPRASLLLSMTQPRYLLSQLVELGQTFSISLGAAACAITIGPLVPSRPESLLVPLACALLFGVVSLLVANLVPPYRRDETSDRPLPRVVWLCYPLYLLLILPSILLQKTQNLFVSELETKAIKEEELRQIVESETEEGTIEVEEREMIEGIFEFGETTVKEVMVPRIDMVCVEISTPSTELLDLIYETRHSRIPIYRERIDQIEGVVYVKDLLHVPGDGKDWRIEDVMRKPPYFVPENKKIDDLLREFKTAKVHMAIVVGEYGGTSGLVTLEDLIEEIVGEIQDEYDEEVQLYHWQTEGSVLVADARIDIEDLNLLLNVELPQDGYETLGGFIYNHLGHVPNPRETFEFANLVMSIEDVIGQRITTVRIEKRESNGTSGEEEEESP